MHKVCLTGSVEDELLFVGITFHKAVQIVDFADIACLKIAGSRLLGAPRRRRHTSKGTSLTHVKDMKFGHAHNLGMVCFAMGNNTCGTNRF